MAEPFMVWSVSWWYDDYNYTATEWFRTEEEAKRRAGEIYVEKCEEGDVIPYLEETGLEEGDDGFDDAYDDLASASQLERVLRWNGEVYFDGVSDEKGPWLKSHQIPDPQEAVVAFLNEHAFGDDIE